MPAEACDHTINVTFNKMPVPGCPVTINISGGMSGPQVSLGGPGPVHQPNSFIINHSGGRLEDIEVNVEGKILKIIVKYHKARSIFLICFLTFVNYKSKLILDVLIFLLPFSFEYLYYFRATKTFILDFIDFGQNGLKTVTNKKNINI